MLRNLWVLKRQLARGMDSSHAVFPKQRPQLTLAKSRMFCVRLLGGGSLALAAIVLLAGCGPELPQDVQNAMKSVPKTVDFNADVRPILSDKCFSCHGPDSGARKAGLRLDQRDAAVATLPETPGKKAIVPGNLAASEVVQRIFATDPDLRMPAKASHKTLSAIEQATLVRWIEQGAEYAAHWAFITPVKPALLGKGAASSKDIDKLIRDRLVKASLQPSPRADAETLITRASFALTGLPPTPDETKAFAADQDPRAWEKLIDRLLASPRYGERMASYWMDVSRFADTDGYQIDSDRRLFPWRDWVIGAFNENLSYDKFAAWQLAGDLVPNATPEQKLATAFNRLHRRNTEEGIDSEEFRVEYVIDRTDTFGRAFLGLTVGCARCHDHKYDPISQKAYYQLYAFFNSTNENGMYIDGANVAPGAAMALPTPQQDQVLAEANAKVVKGVAELEAARRGAQAAAAAWAAKTGHEPATLDETLRRSLETGLAAYVPFERVTGSVEDPLLEAPAQLTPNVRDPSRPVKLREPKLGKGVKGNAFFIGDYSTAYLDKSVGRFDHTDPFTIDLWVYPDRVYPTATVVQGSNPERRGHRGYNLFLENNRLRFMFSHSWPQDYLEVVSEDAIPVRQWSHVTVAYSGDKAPGVHLYINGKATRATTRHDTLTRTAAMGVTPLPFYGPPGINLGARPHISHMKGGGLDELRIYDRQLSDIEIAYLHDPGLAKEKASDTTDQALSTLRSFSIARQPAVVEAAAKLQRTRADLVKAHEDVAQIMVMGDVAGGRPSYILKRGVFSDHGEQVEPAALSAILPFDASLPRNRLGLAQWLFDPENPLTARVFVNHLWQLHFGRGLVDTAADFGAQGAVPSNRELLDWLAVAFIESGWDIKAMHKLILMSSTYQQSSVMSPESQAADPANVLLARGPRFRLPAEMIRDNALAASGLLVERLGGESQFPYQPPGYSESSPGLQRKYPAPETVGDGLYRRSLYTHWRRSAPPPFMMIFDKTDADVCTVGRATTSSPLQALALLNDTQFVEAARVLAQKVSDSVPGVPERLATLFYQLLRRSPSADELETLQSLYDAQLDRFMASPEDAARYVNVGATAVGTVADTPSLASLSVVASVILNTPDAYTQR